MNGDERPTRAISGQLVETIAGELEQFGLNMFAVLDRRIVDDCALSDRALNDPDAYSSTPRNHAVSDAVCDRARGDVASDDTTPSSEIRSVALIGNSGRRLWNCLPDVTGQEHLVESRRCNTSEAERGGITHHHWVAAYILNTGCGLPTARWLCSLLSSRNRDCRCCTLLILITAMQVVHRLVSVASINPARKLSGWCSVPLC